MLIFEKNYNYKNYKKNGLSNLNYNILYKNTFKNNYHIIVDLQMDESYKLYPKDFEFKESILKEKYNKETNSLLYKVKQIKF